MAERGANAGTARRARDGRRAHPAIRHRVCIRTRSGVRRLTILVPIGAGFGPTARGHTRSVEHSRGARPQSAPFALNRPRRADHLSRSPAAAQLPQRRGVLGRRRAGRPRWTARRARSSVPRGRRRLPRCAAPRAHLCWHTRLLAQCPAAAHRRWPSLRRWLVCARGWRRRSARARGREARRLPLAHARWRRVCRRHCPAAESRERDLSPSPGQPPSTAARRPGLLGRARRARRALGALERARLRRSCADARSGSVVARAPAGATHTALQASGFSVRRHDPT